MKLWYRGKEILINKVVDLAHKEDFKKKRRSYHFHCRYFETLCVKIFHGEVTQALENKTQKVGNSDLTNSENLVELLQQGKLYISRQTITLIIYGFLCFIVWLVYVK